jgi:hypothetical protein
MSKTCWVTFQTVVARTGEPSALSKQFSFPAELTGRADRDGNGVAMLVEVVVDHGHIWVPAESLLEAESGALLDVERALAVEAE